MTNTQELNILVVSSIEKSYTDALSRFIATVKSAFSCYSVCYFELSGSQDSLVLSDSTITKLSGLPVTDVIFPVTAMENPLVYAMISGKPYRVDNPYLAGRDAYYEQFIKRLSPTGSVLCYPVFSAQKKARGVLLLEGEQQTLADLMESTSFKSMSVIFANTLNLYQVIEAKKHEAGVQHRVSQQHSKGEIDKQALQQISNQLLGKSDVMLKLQRDVMQVSRSDVTVMLRGATGVGKDVAALAIHRASIRRNNAFIVVNCAAILEHLFEAEFFGYQKGAFEGANDDKAGVIAQADGGTLYLDEISSLSLSLQAKLLRVLEEKSFMPLGAEEEQKSNFRLITASHQPLEQQVESGEFRPDLFYRINQYMITLPVLQQRVDDIALLLEHFILEFMQEHRLHIKGYEPGIVQLLQQYDFPGNIRELKNLIFKACLTAEQGKKITVQDIREHIDSSSSGRNDSQLAIGLDHMAGSSLSEYCSSIEQKIIKKTLEQCAGSRTKAAKRLGIPKRTLAYKCKKWDIIVEY